MHDRSSQPNTLTSPHAALLEGPTGSHRHCIVLGWTPVAVLGSVGMWLLSLCTWFCLNYILWCMNSVLIAQLICDNMRPPPNFRSFGKKSWRASNCAVLSQRKSLSLHILCDICMSLLSIMCRVFQQCTNNSVCFIRFLLFCHLQWCQGC